MGEEGKPGLRIGISECLLGRMVRWDGGHKRDDFLTKVLAPFVGFVPVCPEVEIGLGTPREPIQLRRAGTGDVLLVGNKTGEDHSERMLRYAQRRVAQLARLDLHGYVLKKDSPTCGMERVRVHVGDSRPPSRDGVGLFARVLLERMPLLPVEDEGRLHDPDLRENFIERVFAYRRMRELFGGRWTAGDLVRFYTAHKLLLMAHEPAGLRRLGALVAKVKELPRAELVERYQTELMLVLRRIATRRRHTNVLQHMAGYLKHADLDDRRELEGVIEDFRRGLVPLVVPVTLVRHLVRRYQVAYLAGQLYLEPHPKELMLRNHS